MMDREEREEWLKSPGYAKLKADDALNTALTLSLIKAGKWLTAGFDEFCRGVDFGDAVSLETAMRRAYFEGAYRLSHGMLVAGDDQNKTKKEDLREALQTEIFDGLSLFKEASS